MSGGTWTQGDVNSPQTRPGAYFNVIAQAVALLEAGLTGTVFVVGRADWGPVDEATEIRSAGESDTTFGTGLSLGKLVKAALKGGAAVVKALRIAAASEASATATLDDTVAAAALDLTAKYSGTRANSFTLTVSAHPVAGKVLELKENGVLLETHYAATGENDEFVTVINDNSVFLTAALNGAADRVLADVTDDPMAGGDSGAGVVAGDYTAAQTLAENESFNVYVQDDDATDANQDAAATWAQGRRAAGQRFILVMGSDAADSLTTAQGRANAQDDEGIVYVHPGFTDVDGVVFTGQEAAARVAGLIASAGVTQSITFDELPDAESVEATLSGPEIQAGLQSGLCLLVTDNSGTTRVEKGINTFISYGSDPNRTKAFSKIRTVMTVDAVQNGLADALNAYIGDTTNDEDGQKSLLGAGQAFLDELERSRAIKPGSTLVLDDANPPTADSVFLVVGLTPLDSIEQVFVTINVGE